MAVTFDAIGPSSAGKASATSPATWTHPGGASPTAVLVGVAVDSVSDSAVTVAVTYGGTAMPSVLRWESGGSTEALGFIQVFKLLSPASGSQTVSVTVTGSFDEITGGSLSYNGAGAFSAAVHGDSAAANSSGASLAVPTGSAANMAACFICNGSGGTAWTAGTSRYVVDGTNGAAAGHSAGATLAGTGSSVTFSWTQTADFYAAIGIEVQSSSTPVSGADSARATEASGVAGGTTPHGSDAGHGAEASSVHATLPAAADSAHAAETGSTAKYITGSALAGDGSKAWFTDQQGAPRLYVGEDSWNLIWEGPNWTTPAGNYQSVYDTYLSQRAAQGYTAVEVTAFSYPNTNNPSGSPSNGTDWDGTWPFTSTNDPSSGMNSTFWARRDYFVQSAAKNGITVQFNLTTTSSTNSSDIVFGWTSAQWTAFGTAIGNRYKAQPNILWILGDDYFGALDANLGSFLTALRATGDTHLISIQNQQETTSRYAFNPTHAADPNSWDIHAQFDWVYTYNPAYNGVTYAQQHEPSASDVVASQVPVVWGDGFYVASGVGAGQTDVRLERQNIWWALSSGACGFSTGDNDIWVWASGSAGFVTSKAIYSSWIPAITAAFKALPGWHKLVSDFSSVLVTAGRGTPAADVATGSNGYTANTDAYVSASRVPDGSLAVIYCASAFSITIDQTKLKTGYSATWIDPVNGTKYAGTTGSTYNSGAVDGSKAILNSAGDPDWVLALEGPLTVPGADSPHGAEGSPVKLGVGAPITAPGWVS